MSFSIGVRHFFDESGNATILDCEGSLTLGQGTQVLRTTIIDQIEQGHKNLILNLDEIFYHDLSGIGEILDGSMKIMSCGGTLKLLSPPKLLAELLEIQKINKILGIFSEEEEALASFFPNNEQVRPKLKQFTEDRKDINAGRRCPHCGKPIR